MKRLSIAALLIMVVGSFMWFRSKPEKVKTESKSNSTASVDGEMGPYFTGEKFRYVGAFFNTNFAYIMKDEAGALSSDLQDNKKVADVWTASELVSIIVQQPQTKKFAVLDPSNPETKDLRFDQMKFREADKDSQIAKAWAKATNPSEFPKDRKQGKTQNWVYVEATNNSQQTELLYVGDEVKTNTEYNVKFVPLLAVKKWRYTFYLDPINKKFAPVRSDMMGSPLEEISYRDMTTDGIGESVLKTLISKP